MTIGVIDADLMDNGTRHPNLALMKISGYYKANGYEVNLIENYEEIDNYDKVFVSKVFSFTQIPDWVVNHKKVSIGGTGFFEDGGEPLDYEIEHHIPDYTLYNTYIKNQIKAGKKEQRFSDYLKYSIGFATRGCFRKCDFCVNKKYDRACRHSPIKEFLDESREAIYLWDDNILAYSGWEEVLDELEATNKPFQFRQGLDIRLLTEKSAKRFAKTKYHGDFIFAFDHLEDREIIERKLKLWRRHTSKTTKLYVLCAYDSQDERDIVTVFERIKILMKYGCLPYIMRYELYMDSQYKSLYTQIARWCNQPQFLKKMSFRQFCEANQAYHKNKATNCSAYQSMLNFETSFPHIAERYFDLRFEEVNEYSISLGFGRKYPHKPDCINCELSQNTWIRGVNGVVSEDCILQQYFLKNLDLQCLLYKSSICIEKQPYEIAEWFAQLLMKYNPYKIIELISKSDDRDIVVPSNIPQFSNLHDATHEVIRILVESGLEGISYDEMGGYLNPRAKNLSVIAKRKYGENHSKMATFFDLAVINFPQNKAVIMPSLLGKVYYHLSENQKNDIIIKLILRIPIIQEILIKAINEKVVVTDFLYQLSPQTRKRRQPNVIKLLKIVKNSGNSEIYKLFENITERR